MGKTRRKGASKVRFRQLGPHRRRLSAATYPTRPVRMDLSIPVQDAVLAASVSTPDNGAAPALVALHGAERGVRHWYLYEHLHRVLPPAGIAAVTFDRRGEGASTGEPSRGRFVQQAEDALAVIDHACEAAGLDADRV